MRNQELFKGVIFQSGTHGIVPIDHPMEHGEVDAPIYAFQSWGSGLDFQVSALYEGQAALDFIDSHYESGTFASLWQGGEDIKREYAYAQEYMAQQQYEEMWV